MKRKHKGSSLVIALGISLSLLILIMAVSTTLSAETKASVNQQKKIQAYYIARGGAEAAAEWITTMTINQKIIFNDLVFPLRSNGNSLDNNENNTFDLTIDKQAEQITITSIGKIDNVTDTETLILKKQSSNNDSNSTIKAAVWGLTNLSIKSNVNGDIGISSNNPIILDWGFNFDSFKKNNKIYTNGTVNKPNDSNPVQIQPLSESYNYTSPIFEQPPSNLTNMPNISLNGGEPSDGSHYSINGNTYYDTITVAADRFLQINTNNQPNTKIRVKNLDFQQGKLIINGTGNVTLFIDNLINLKGTINKNESTNTNKQLILNCNTYSGSLNLDNGIYINGSLYIGNSSINITGGATITGDVLTTSNNLTMEGGSTALSGIIYAPNANINLKGGATITGAIIGNSVSLEGGATVTYNPNVKLDINTTNSSNIDTYTRDHWK